MLIEFHSTWPYSAEWMLILDAEGGLPQAENARLS